MWGASVSFPSCKANVLSPCRPVRRCYRGDGFRWLIRRPWHLAPSKMSAQLDPKRTIAELKELRTLTGDHHGAQRVAFTATWLMARSWLREKLQQLPVEVAPDQAGNLWATLRGKSPRT